MSGLLLQSEDAIVVGQLGRPHGVRGWQRIVSFTEPLEQIRSYPILYAKRRGQWVGLADLQWQVHKGALLVKLPEVDSPETAKLWSKTELAVSAQDLPQLDDPDEFYWRDLIECEVRNQADQVLGVVDSLLETGAHDVVVINPPPAEEDPDTKPRQLLIPFTQAHVVQVDLTQRRILVDWEADWA